MRDVKELENERNYNRERDNMREIGNVRVREYEADR